MSEPLTIKTAQQFFFDRAAVQKATANMNKRSLSSIGAGIRTVDRRSQRPAGKKGKVSRPGEPPRVRMGQLKKFTYFVYSPETESVVVGPVLLGGKQKTGQTVPNLIEEGGNTRQELKELSGGLVVPARSRLARESQGRIIVQRGKYEPRRHTRPAFDAEKPKFADKFKGQFNSS
mgnify:FL=1